MLIGYLQIGYLFWLPARQYGLQPTLLSPRAISISGNAHWPEFINRETGSHGFLNTSRL